MEIDITKTSFKKVVSKEFKITLPTKPTFYFITGTRYSYSLKPIFYDNMEGDPLYRVIVVGLSGKCFIEVFDLEIKRISDIYSNPSPITNPKIQQLVNHLVESPDDDVRDKTMFDVDFSRAMEKIQENRNY